MKLNYNISIHQTACKNKATPFKCILNHKVKFITFFILPRGTLENIFKVKCSAQLKVRGLCKKLVRVRLSVKYKVK